MNESWECQSESSSEEVKRGFTIIEVMLVLAITGLMLVGVIAGTYSSIATQRYNDSVRSFSEFLREIYAEVISPQSLGEGNSDTEAVYGKIAVFGIDDGGDEDIVYTATLVGGVKPPRNTTNFIAELGSGDVKAHLFCGKEASPGVEAQSSTLDEYIPMWEAKINDTSNHTLEGTLIIARSPASGTVHTAFTTTVYDIKGDCQGASNRLQQDLQTSQSSFNTVADVDFCIVSDNSRVVRDIRLAADGHNSSAISLIPTDGEDNKCPQK